MQAPSFVVHTHPFVLAVAASMPLKSGRVGIVQKGKVKAECDSERKGRKKKPSNKRGCTAIASTLLCILGIHIA